MKLFNRHNKMNDNVDPNVAVLETAQSGGFLDKLKSSMDSIANVSRSVVEAVDKALDKLRHSDVAKTAKAVGFSVAVALAPACASGDEPTNTDSQSSIEQEQKELKLISEGFYDGGFRALFEAPGKEIEVDTYLDGEYIGPAYIFANGEFLLGFKENVNVVAIEHNGNRTEFMAKDGTPDLF